jgi:hypothetical protein
MMPSSPHDDYPVLMWNFVDPMFTSGAEKADLAIARFREMGCTGATLISSFVDHADYRETYRRLGLGAFEHAANDHAQYRYRENDFPFYVMNLCPALYWGWDKAKPVFAEQYAAFERDGDRSVFVRRPCVNDPAVEIETLRRVGHVMEGLADLRDLTVFYDYRDEASVTSFILASDSCFCEHCMARMRPWLASKYGDLEALNAEWETEFADWDQVVPLTSQEALERRRQGHWNFSPWHDHRAFNDATFARICGLVGDEIARRDPQGRSGATGTQCPSVFGGYDFSQLVPACDWVEAYDFGRSVDLWRSFKARRDLPIVKTDFHGAEAAVLEAMLWTYVFQSGGYGGTILWESNSLIDTSSETLALTDNAIRRGEVFAGLRSGLPKLLQQCDEISSPVAVLYSHASVNADFITAVADRWRSVAAWDPERYPAYHSREAWWVLLEDRGLRPIFVHSGQLEAGVLGERGVQLLVLPRSIALSDAEGEAIRRFVEAGGVVAADSAAGRMDEHCRERDVGVLDELFGVWRTGIDGYHTFQDRASFDWETREPGQSPVWGGGPLRAECSLIEGCVEPRKGATVLGRSEYADAPLGFYAEHGAGKAVLFNAAPLDYRDDRRRAGGGRNFQSWFGHILSLAGVEPLAEIADADSGEALTGWRLWEFAHGEARYFGVAPDLNISQDVLGAISAADEGAATQRLRIRLAKAGHLYEARSGRYLGDGDTAVDTLSATSARLYSVMPYRVDALALTRKSSGYQASLSVSGAAAGEHVFRFDWAGADGARDLDRGANVIAAGGEATWTPSLPLPADGSVTCTDVATGVSAHLRC